MQRTNIIELKPNKIQTKIIKEMMLLSSCVYNITNYEVRKTLFNNEKSKSFFDLQQLIQNKEDYKKLGRSYALPRIQIYSETNNARWKLIKSKKQNNVGLPKYLKNRKTNTTIPSFLAIDGCQYKINKFRTTIPLSRQLRNKYNLKQFKIKYNGVIKWKGKQLRGQIHYKNNKYYLYQSVEVKQKNQNKKDNKKIFNNKVGIDLGIKRIFGLYSNNGISKLIGSNRYYKQWKHYTKLISIEQTKLSKINKKVSNKLHKLYQIRIKWQNNLFNNLVAKLFRILNKNKISEIYVGDITNIRTSSKTKSKRSKEDKLKYSTKSIKKNNQMINNYWSFDKLYNKIENKAEEYNIIFNKITEEYSSTHCPICHYTDKNNSIDRIFKCLKCGHLDDRDIIGAKNIYLKGMYGSYKSIHRDEVIPLEVSI